MEIKLLVQNSQTVFTDSSHFASYHNSDSDKFEWLYPPLFVPV